MYYLADPLIQGFWPHHSQQVANFTESLLARAPKYEGG